ncbi:MAG: TrmB family transcriptional regulator [Nanoarchaeota archaeon]
MENKISVLLKEYGLNENEIKIYTYLLNQENTAYKVAKETNIHRSTCYDILERLIAKGFISQLKKDSVMFYYANEIDKVISQLKDKENILINLVPLIRELEKEQDNKLKLLKGPDGQKQFNFTLYGLAREKKIKFCYILGNTYASNLSSNLFIESLIKESKKFKIDYRGIWNPKFKEDKIIEIYTLLGENRFLDLPSKVATIIYGEYIAFLYTTDQPYAIEIKNKILAEEFKTYFEHLWKISKH